MEKEIDDKDLEKDLENLDNIPSQEIPEKKKENSQQPDAIKPQKKVQSLGDLTQLSEDILEEKLHNLEKMASALVLENEINLCEKMSNESKDLKEIYVNKKESAEFQMDFIVKGLDNGAMTIPQYITGVTKELVYEENLLATLKVSKVREIDIKRIEKRIELIKKDLEMTSQQLKASQPQETLPDSSKTDKKVESKIPEKPLEKNNHEEEKIPTKQSDNRETQSEMPKLEKQHSSTDPSQFLLEDDENDIDFNKVDKEQFEILKKRIDDYRDAATYLLNNGITEQGKNIVKKIDILKSCLELVRQGKKIDILKIEPPITPEILFGCPHKKRIETFELLINTLQKKAANAKNYLDQQAKAHKKDKNGIAEAQNKIKNCVSLVNALKGFMKNPWTPLPVFHIETSITESSIMLKDISANELLLEYNPDPKMQKKHYYKMFFELSGPTGSSRGEFAAFDKMKVKIPFPKGCKNIHECTLSLKLQGRMYFLFKPIRASIDTKLTALESATTMLFNIPENRNKYKINAIAKVRMPANGNDKIETKSQELVIDKFFQPYKAEIASSDIVKTANIAPHPKKAKPIKEIATGASAPPKKAPVAQNGEPPLPEKLPEMPPEISIQDIKDPDNIGNLTCASYLEKSINHYNQIIKERSNKGEKIPEIIQTRVQNMVRNKYAIENQINSGKLTPETYKSFLMKQLEKDKILANYLDKLGQKQKSAIVKDRMACIIKEIKSF